MLPNLQPPITAPVPPTHPSLHSVTAALDFALRLPRQLPVVASWLFPDNTDTPFPDAPALSPSFFERSLTLVSESTFIPFRNASPTIAAAPRTATYFLVLIPMRSDHQVTLGYTFHVGLPAADALFPVADVLRSKFALVGRFAFDRIRHQLLIFVKDFTDNTSHLGVVDRWPYNERRLQFVSLPKHSFSATRLPSEALGVTVACQTVDDSTPPQTCPTQPQEQNYHIGTNNPSFSCYNGSTNPAAHAEMPSGRGEGQLLAPFAPRRREEATFLTCAQNATHTFATSPDSLDPFSLRRSITELRSCLSGRFRSCKITRDMPSTSDLGGPVAVGLFTSFTRDGDRDEAELLQRFAARTYYAAVLSVSNDMRLVECGEGQEEEGR